MSDSTVEIRDGVLTKCAGGRVDFVVKLADIRRLKFFKEDHFSQDVVVLGIEALATDNWFLICEDEAGWNSVLSLLGEYTRCDLHREMWEATQPPFEQSERIVWNRDS
ncbi:MAG: hypothetical protein AAGD00_05440 [Planctomycetota bacterium]